MQGARWKGGGFPPLCKAVVGNATPFSSAATTTKQCKVGREVGMCTVCLALVHHCAHLPVTLHLTEGYVPCVDTLAL